MSVDDVPKPHPNIHSGRRCAILGNVLLSVRNSSNLLNGVPMVRNFSSIYYSYFYHFTLTCCYIFMDGVLHLNDQFYCWNWNVTWCATLCTFLEFD